MNIRVSAARRVGRHAPSLLVLGGIALVGAHAPVTARTTGSSTAPEFARVSLASGIEIHYAAIGDAEAPAVLLLHGYSDSWFSFSRILPLLPDGYRVLAPDLRGHGRSERPEEGYSTDDLAADVVAFMDALGIERAAVVGHSMGSFVAQGVLRRAPERVTGLVLIASATSLDRVTGIDEFAATIASLEDPVPPAFVREFQAGTVFEPVPAEFMDEVVSESLRLSAKVWHALFDGMRSAGRFGPADGVAPPTLLVWGERDAMMPRSEQDALLSAYPGARLIVYEETGHAPHWERPVRVAGDLRAFLDGLGREAPADDLPGIAGERRFRSVPGSSGPTALRTRGRPAH